MKKLIYILLLLLSVGACAQDSIKISEFPLATDPDANDLLYFIEDGASRNITKSLLQQSLTDDISDVTGDVLGLTNDVSDLNDSITVLRGLYDNLMVEVNLIWDTIDYYHGSSPPDPPSVWEDSVDMLISVNWDNITAQVGGSHHDTITQAFDYLYFVGAELDNIFQNLGIVDQGGGDHALRSYFPEGQCCLESDDEGEPPPPIANGGTAGYWQVWYDSPHTEYQEVWEIKEITLDEDFILPEGTKLPGANLNHNDMPQRLMLVDEPGGMQLQFYTSRYNTDVSEDHVRYASLVSNAYLTAGTKHQIAQRWYANSSDGGFHEVYLDGILMDKRTSMRYNNSVNPTHYFDGADFSLFMGGYADYYQSSQDQGHNMDNNGGFTVQDGVQGIEHGVSNDIGTDLSDMLDGVIAIIKAS